MKTQAIVCSAAICISSAAWGADKLPLKRGIFVDADVKCNERSNATATSFWGNELNTARSRGNIRSVRKQGKTFTVVLDIEEEGSRRRETLRIKIPSPTRMTIETDSGTWTQRWCSESM